MAKLKNPLPLTVKWQSENKREVYLDYLIKKNNWQIGIEVGVRFGRTLFYLLDNNPQLRMIAVDIDVSQFYNDEIKNKYLDRLIVLEGDSSAIATKIKHKVDFVFIDGAHSKKAVKKDVVAYMDLLNHISGLTGHDIDYPSIQSALQELDIAYDVGPDNVWTYRN